MKKSFFTKLLKRCIYISLYSFLGLFFSGVIYAQEEEGGGGGGFSLNLPINFGARIGTTISSFSDAQPHTNSVHGVLVGGFANYEINTSMAVQLELLYTQEGGRLLYFDMPFLIGKDFWYMVDVENQQLVLHNLNVPVLFRYTIAIGGLNLVGMIGPDLGYTMQAIVDKEGTLITETQSFHTYTGTENVTSKINKFHFAGTAGLGLEVPVGENNVLVDFRYRYGFTSVYNSYSYVGIPQITGDLKNHTISLSVGLEF